MLHFIYLTSYDSKYLKYDIQFKQCLCTMTQKTPKQVKRLYDEVLDTFRATIQPQIGITYILSFKLF